MKRQNLWSILMLMALAFPLMIACGGDDSDDKGSNGGNNNGNGGGNGGGTPTATFNIIGTWRAYYQSNDPSRGEVYDLVTFNSDKTGTIIEEVGYGSDNPLAFVWTQTGNVIKVGVEDMTITWTIQQIIDDNTAVVSDGKRDIKVYRDGTGGGGGGGGNNGGNNGGGSGGGGTTPADSTMLYEEPYINWGASRATVKSNRSAAGYTLKYDFDTFISYEPKYREQGSRYSFDESGGLSMSSVQFDASTISFSALCDYVGNTLGAIYDSTSSDGTTWFNAKDGKALIFVTQYDDGDVGVVYVEPWGSSPAFKGNKAKIREMDRQMEALNAKKAQRAVKALPHWSVRK